MEVLKAQQAKTMSTLSSSMNTFTSKHSKAGVPPGNVDLKEFSQQLGNQCHGQAQLILNQSLSLKQRLSQAECLLQKINKEMDKTTSRSRYSLYHHSDQENVW